MCFELPDGRILDYDCEIPGNLNRDFVFDIDGYWFIAGAGGADCAAGGAA